VSDLDDAMRRYYARRAPEYDDWYERRGRYDDPATNAPWHAEVAELERIAATGGTGHLLDVACGTGRWTARFAANPAVARVTALDRAPEMLERTRARLAGLALTAELVRGDAYALPFAADSFDSCFFGFFLSHVPLDRVAGFLGELRRVLRPGGEILVFDSLLAPGREPLQVQERPLNDGSRHRVLKIYYTPETLAAVLAELTAPGSVATRATGAYFVVGRATMPPR
jgi:ubiquinone/menaquinone biosynthesis C-methylase UbiE